MDLFDTVVLIATIVACILSYFQLKFLYWRNKNIPYIKPSIPFGTSENPFSRNCSLAIEIQTQYQHFKSMGYKFGGLFTSLRPKLLVTDLGLIRCVMYKDFQFFVDRGSYYNEKQDPLSAHLFNLEGERWRNLRAKLTPTFTTGKIKNMFPTLISCSEPLHAVINEYAQKNIPVDIKDVLGCFTTDVIGSCGFGLDCNSFKEPEGDFKKYAKLFFSGDTKLEALKRHIAFWNPSFSRFLRITLSKAVCNEFFLDAVKSTVAYREDNNVTRNDFMQLVMALRKNDVTGGGLTIEEIAAQAVLFFLAGFETSSTTMAFCLYELAINQKIQDHVRDEINKTLNNHDENITYEAIMEMKYLNQVIEETLRKYPPVPELIRIATQDYQIPDTDIVLEKGTCISIPAYALHHDPEYFPDPEEFDPERFSEVNRSSIFSGSYMPFGEGPRNCIGLRFGLLQTKVGLVSLLKNFKFFLNSRTQNPLEFSKYAFILHTNGAIWLDIEKV